MGVPTRGVSSVSPASAPPTTQWEYWGGIQLLEHYTVRALVLIFQAGGLCPWGSGLNDINRWAQRHHPFQKKSCCGTYSHGQQSGCFRPTVKSTVTKKNCATLAKIKTTPLPSHRTGDAGWVGASSPYPRHLGHKLGTHTLHHAGCHQGLPCPVVVKQRRPRAGKHQGGHHSNTLVSTRFEGHVGIGDPLRTTSFHCCYTLTL